MTRSHKLLVLTLAGLIICPAYPQTEAPDSPSHHLVFRPDHRPHMWPVRVPRGQEVLTPTHVARFYCRIGRQLPQTSGLLQTDVWPTLSEKQRQFCRTSRIWHTESADGTALSNYRRINIYAVSEEDAKKMARAFVELLYGRFLGQCNSAVAQKTALGQDLSEGKQALAKDEARFKEVCTQFDKAKHSPRYLSLQAEEASEEAKATILQMSARMDEIVIELAETKARLEAIAKLRQRSNTLSPLRTMEEEFTIQLAGIEAKRKAVDGTLTAASRFRHLYLERHRLGPQIDRAKKRLATQERDLKKLAARLDDQRLHFEYPEVHQNRVTICPASHRN